MSLVKFFVSNKAGANLRTNPCKEVEIKKKLPYLSVVDVNADWKAINSSGGAVTTYLPVKDGSGYLYVSADLVSAYKSPAQLAPLAAEYVYSAIYDNNIPHVLGKGSTLNSILSGNSTDCAGAVSAVLDMLNVISAGKRVSHTKAGGKKTKVEDVIKGLEFLDKSKCTVAFVNKPYAKLTAAQKKAGVVYVQNSNICVSAGGGRIWSCNATGETYGVKGKAVLRTSGYPFTSKILCVIVPKG